MELTSSAKSRVYLSETLHAGIPHWRIETESCVWYFDPAGGGFSRLADRDGLDWIGFEPGPPPHSYRGIPNIQTFTAGKFSGIFHPGYTSVSSAILEAGPRSVIIESTSGAGGSEKAGESEDPESAWVCRWAIFPDRAVCTVLRGLPCGFAFLYEGTPGGGPFDGSKDFMRLPSCEKFHFSRGAKDKLFIPAGEAPDTVRFGRDGIDRELEFSFERGLGSRTGIGQYSVYGALTVFGFGREEEPGIRDYPATFTLRFVETGSSSNPYRGQASDCPVTRQADTRIPSEPRERVSCSLDGIDVLRIAGRPSAFFSVSGRTWHENVTHGDGKYVKTEAGSSGGLAWSLNGGSPRRLALGPDDGRLVGAGDFVADIPWSELRVGANELSFLAMGDDEAGPQPGACAPPPGESPAGGTGAISPPSPHASAVAKYSFLAELSPFPELPVSYDFESGPHTRIRGASLCDALPIDGEWQRNSDGIAPSHPGYDRLLAFGDLSLRDYRLRAEITLRGFAVDAPGYPESMGPGVGFLLRWSGHHPDGLSPFREWRPIGALGWYRYGRDKVDTVRDFRLQLLGGRMKADTQSEAIAEDRSGRKLDVGIRYVFLLEVDGRKEYPARYGFKVWMAGDPEPGDWDITAPGLPGEARSGSALLVLHYADAILHLVSIEPLSGDAAEPLQAPRNPEGYPNLTYPAGRA